MRYFLMSIMVLLIWCTWGTFWEFIGALFSRKLEVRDFIFIPCGISLYFVFKAII
jgi:hypothetical protein